MLPRKIDKSINEFVKKIRETHKGTINAIDNARIDIDIGMYYAQIMRRPLK